MSKKIIRINNKNRDKIKTRNRISMNILEKIIKNFKIIKLYNLVDKFKIL